MIEHWQSHVAGIAAGYVLAEVLRAGWRFCKRVATTRRRLALVESGFGQHVSRTMRGSPAVPPVEVELCKKPGCSCGGRGWRRTHDN